TVGSKGQLETAAEIRIETVLPVQRVAEVVQALRKAHPYEEPAFDLVQLAAHPEGIGMGRIGKVRADRAELVERVKRELGLERVLVAGPTTGPTHVAACCAGACGKLLDDALRQRAD